MGSTHSPQAQMPLLGSQLDRRGRGQTIQVLKACAALRATTQGRHAMTSSLGLRPTSLTLISCSESNLFLRQLTTEMTSPGRESLSHPQEYGVAHWPQQENDSAQFANTSAFLQGHLAWDSTSPALLNCFLLCFSPSKR